MPLVDIGSADGEESELLNGAESAWRSADGGIFFSNTGTQEIRYYDSTGRFLRSIGRRGGGPGEFDPFGAMNLAPVREGVLAGDDQNMRVHLFGGDGKLIRTVLLLPGETVPRPTFLAGFDSFLVVEGRAFPTKPTETWIDSAHIFRYRLDGSPANAVTAVPRRSYRAVSSGNESPMFLTVPMTPTLALLADSSSLLTRASAEPIVERWSWGGHLLARHRWGGGQRRRSADYVDRYRKSLLARSDGSFRRAVEALYRQGPAPPEWVPTHTRLVEGPDGTVWIQHYHFDWEPEGRWDVLDRTGRWLGTVAMPAGHWLYRAGADYVLARHRDELDVEHVTLHRLRRGR